MEDVYMMLEPGKEYTLKYSKQFCHCVGNAGFIDFSANLESKDRIKAIFVGTIKLDEGKRNIFYSNDNFRSYFMFSIDKLDYIAYEK